MQRKRYVDPLIERHQALAVAILDAHVQNDHNEVFSSGSNGQQWSLEPEPKTLPNLDQPSALMCRNGVRKDV
jgi:hypothetical protein